MESVWLVVYMIVGCSLMAMYRWERKRVETARQAALEAYERALADLAEDQTNEYFEQRALALGRRYAALARRTRSALPFDEETIRHDIRRATAAARMVAAATSDVVMRLSCCMALIIEMV